MGDEDAEESVEVMGHGFDKGGLAKLGRVIHKVYS
jgi:hypothetical protein